MIPVPRNRIPESDGNPVKYAVERKNSERILKFLYQLPDDRFAPQLHVQKSIRLRQSNSMVEIAISRFISSGVLPDQTHYFINGNLLFMILRH
jgi:hypothetical protein